jgi:hypothetical protein
VRPSLAELYEGQMLERAAEWWNELLDKRPALVSIAGASRLDRSGVKGTRGKLEPKNRPLMAARARSLCPYGALAEGAYVLGYCLARVFAAGTNSDWQHNAQHIAPGQLTENDHHYDQVGIWVSDYADVPSEGYWRELELRSLWNRLTIEPIRWAYRDQVKRWEHAEGVEMGQGIGFAPMEELKLVERFDELLFEHGARFYETETAVDAYQTEQTDS